MKLTEAIKQLNEVKNKYGDIEVNITIENNNLILIMEIKK